MLASLRLMWFPISFPSRSVRTTRESFPAMRDEMRKNVASASF
ncbi:MAG: hypothetical protein ACR2GK_06375 [Gemmatimonadaceae bacterium]